jgi:hypothetical protein
MQTATAPKYSLWGRLIWARTVPRGDLIFNDRREYKNGCAFVVRQYFKEHSDNKIPVLLGEIDGKVASAITSQVRLVDARRFIDKIGMLEQEKFEALKNAVRELF